jgi:hypothetical protein
MGLPVLWSTPLDASARIGLVFNSRTPYFPSIVPVQNVPVNAASRSKAEAHPRYLMELSPELLALLNQLASRPGESASIEDVMKKAIALFDVATQAKGQGQKIAILDKDDKLVREIIGI